MSARLSRPAGQALPGMAVRQSARNLNQTHNAGSCDRPTTGGRPGGPGPATIRANSEGGAGGPVHPIPLEVGTDSEERLAATRMTAFGREVTSPRDGNPDS